MEEILLASAPVILAMALAVAMRLLRSRREASSEIEALQKKLAALRQRNSELEVDLALARQRATCVSPREKHPVCSSPPISPVDPRESAANSWRFTRSENEVDDALHRLHVIQALLPPYGMVEEKYIAEVEAIVERLGRATGMNMSRWLGISQPEVPPGAPPPGLQTRLSRLGVQPRDRDVFRFTILSLLAFCNYQINHWQSPRGFVPPPPEAARRIH
jgi:hypothetical protein